MSREHPPLVEAVEHLTCKLHEILVQRNNEFEWMRSHHGLATSKDLERLGNLIMASQAEIIADLKLANEKLTKLVADTSAYQTSVDILKAEIVRLEALVAAGGTITQELVDTVAETKRLAQVVDDNVPELPTPPPAG